MPPAAVVAIPETVPVAPQGVAPPGTILPAERLKFGGVAPKNVASFELASALALVTSGSETPPATVNGRLKVARFMLACRLNAGAAATGASFTGVTVMVNVWSAELSTP